MERNKSEARNLSHPLTHNQPNQRSSSSRKVKGQTRANQGVGIRASNFVLISSQKVTDNYKIGRKIDRLNSVPNQGLWSIHECTHILTGHKRSVKIYDKSEMSPTERKQLFREIVMIKNVDHPNLPQLYEMYDDLKRYYIIFEDISDCKDLFHYLVKKKTPISELDVINLIKQLLAALITLHAKKIIIRDLRPEKILFSKNGLI